MQKTAYEMRIRDWSSDVCSSDLEVAPGDNGELVRLLPPNGEFAAPAVVVVKAQGRLAPLPFAGDTVEQGSVDLLVARSEARRVGKECVNTCRYRWSLENKKKNKR